MTDTERGPCIICTEDHPAEAEDTNDIAMGELADMLKWDAVAKDHLPVQGHICARHGSVDEWRLLTVKWVSG